MFRLFLLVMMLAAMAARGQNGMPQWTMTELPAEERLTPAQRQFVRTAAFLDAAINSLNVLDGLLRKEAYRLKVTALNNPTSADLGFTLESEVQAALRPLLEKARNTSPPRFLTVVSSLLGNAPRTGSAPVYASLLGLVGNLAVQEKRITREDLDSFNLRVARYFAPFEKLQSANAALDGNLDRLNQRARDLQYDLREYLLDLLAIVSRNTPRSSLRGQGCEELFLRYLEPAKLTAAWAGAPADTALRYPSDGIKGAKDLANNIQKLFNDYQKTYSDNYQQIRSILAEGRRLGTSANQQRVDASLSEVEALFNESKSSDVLSLRLNTLFERVRALAGSEQGR